MPTDQAAPERRDSDGGDQTAGQRPLPPAAARALAEAAARRAERARTAVEPAKEVNGPGGPEPTRYGDWEINGLASDF
jgi:hypothetical protein